MNKWKILHDYYALIHDDLAAPLECGRCQNYFYISRTSKDEPILQCWACDTTITPGIDLLEWMQEQIEEFNQ